MSNRWFRFVIALLALAAAGAAAYRIYQNEYRLSSDVAATRSALLAAEDAITTGAEVKAALHAYVAAGQGHAFWSTRSVGLIDALRASMLTVDAAATAAGAPLTEALDRTDRLADSERRARDYVKSGQALMAGDVIFNDAREHLDAITLDVARGRDVIRQAADRRQAAIRNDQALLAAVAAGVMALALLLLVAPSRRDAADAPAAAATRATTLVLTDADEGIVSGPVVTKRTAPAPAPSAAAKPPAPATPGVAAPKRPGAEPRSGSTASPAAASSVPPQPVAPAPPAPRVPLAEAARLCTDLGRVADSNQLSSLLDRAATVLGASGLIVWMASPDGGELYAVASTGYDPKMVARIGAIARDAANLTAAAFRESVSRSSAAQGPSAAAVATPLVGPQGAVGVLSAELRDVLDVDPDRSAMATIIAAQLAALLGAMATTPTPEIEPAARPAQAQA